ncbi:hypothetical protein Clacol_007449 [Clathrus columnatus]|uniref:Peptidase S28 n=1 Tax=Clathrus columnatus TaxID=1419009 RepID=A0AAV5AKH7_9AGAM|nr:hypothetical protein Clacol_007449 [Clathrus columnatus]
MEQWQRGSAEYEGGVDVVPREDAFKVKKFVASSYKSRQVQALLHNAPEPTQRTLDSLTTLLDLAESTSICRHVVCKFPQKTEERHRKLSSSDFLNSQVPRLEQIIDLLDMDDCSDVLPKGKGSTGFVPKNQNKVPSLGEKRPALGDRVLTKRPKLGSNLKGPPSSTRLNDTLKKPFKTPFNVTPITDSNSSPQPPNPADEVIVIDDTDLDDESMITVRPIKEADDPPFNRNGSDDALDDNIIWPTHVPAADLSSDEERVELEAAYSQKVSCERRKSSFLSIQKTLQNTFKLVDDDILKELLTTERVHEKLKSNAIVSFAKELEFNLYAYSATEKGYEERSDAQLLYLKMLGEHHLWWDQYMPADDDEEEAFNFGWDVRHAIHAGPAALKMALLDEKLREKENKLAQTSNTLANAQHPLSLANNLEFVPRYFDQPIDHDNKNLGTFSQRYWVNVRHYHQGGPIFVLDGGETSGENRLPFLNTGIMDRLPKETGGIGIVLEHRYYGTSMPFANLTTDSLRFLNNYQSAADSANFMRNVKIAGITDGDNVSAVTRPWIYYGGSYAGARAAHMRVLYPEITFGAIASSAVVHAAVSYWEYYDLIRNYTSISCRDAIENTVKTVDFLLDLSKPTRTWVKHLFGLVGLQDDADFASVLSSPLGAWQSMNWDPTVNSTRFGEFCDALAAQRPSAWGLEDFRTLTLGELITFSRARAGNELVGSDLDANASLLSQTVQAHFALFNYANYIRENVVSRCPKDTDVEECFGTTDPEQFLDTSINSTWRCWSFQVCTEWGYFQHAPPDPEHPSLLSRKLTLDYTSRICRQAFPPGEYFYVPNVPNVTAVNSLGDFDLAMDRIAFIDGEIDPWRPACPHSDYASPREDTVERPFKLIKAGVHHWDENGLADPSAEPDNIKKIHEDEVRFVKAWLREWKR